MKKVLKVIAPKSKKNNGFLLFKNSIKQTFRNKIQLVGLAILVLLSSTIFSLMQTSVARINNEYQTLVQKSNLHDFVIDLSDSVKRDDAGPVPPTPPNPPTPNSILEEQQLYINALAPGNVMNNQDSFIWDRVETRTEQLSNNNDPRILKIVAANKYARIDKLVISEGYNIGQNPNETLPTTKQIVINKEFAQKNGLNIGDTMRVQDDRLGTTLKVNYDIYDQRYASMVWFKIVGFGTSADFITPIIDATTPLPNKTREGILYVDPILFGLQVKSNDKNYFWYYDSSTEQIVAKSTADSEIYYVGKSSRFDGQKNDMADISREMMQTYINVKNSQAKLAYALGDSNYRFNNRTSILPNTIDGFTTLLICLLLIVLAITGITVVLITYKNIENTKPQIGILKSLGYSNGKILITSLAYPMIASLIGTILVFLPASSLQILVVSTFANYFNLNFGSFIFNGLGFLYCLILTFGFLSLVAWVISALVVIQNPITLINNISVTRDSYFTKLVKKASIKRGFLTRFRLALFTSSIGKMAAVSLTMFLGTTLMTASIIGPKIMADNQDVTYTGMNYKSLTEYSQPVYNSPFSFYKTYNPTNTPWSYKTETYSNGQFYTHPDRTPEMYLQDLLNNSINQEAYSPIAPNVADEQSIAMLTNTNLPFLYGKMLSKEFLAGLDKSQGDTNFIPAILAFAWPEALPMFSIGDGTSPPIYTDANYQTIRNFYINYRNTIAMSLNPVVAQASDPNKIDITKFRTFINQNPGWQSDQANFDITLDNFQFDTSDTQYPWHIQNESDIIDHPNPPTDANQRNALIRQTLIWFYGLFYNRVGQIVTQGTYTKSPYFIRQNIAKAFEDPNEQFNVSFNALPYDKQYDELGTYFVGNPDISFLNKPYPLKIYGLQSESELGRPSLMQLKDSSGASLNSHLQDTQYDPNDPNSTTSIVINQTIAKQLNLKVGQEFKINPNGQVLETNKDPVSPNSYIPIKVDQIDYSGISNNVPTDNNASLTNMNTKFNQLPSGFNDYTNLGFNATGILKSVQQGNLILGHDETMKNFKVAGIYNGYGQPAAYISKDNADKLLKYDQSKSSFFNQYKIEWDNKGQVGSVDFSTLSGMDYARFSDIPETNPLKIAFNNEFPIFNFKLSASDKLYDITNTFSVSQQYGDYSAFGMNGGLDPLDNTNYPKYGIGTAVNILPLYVHRQLLNQITQLVNMILLFFIIFSLVISFFIILLTSDLVIYENRKIIATMKTLGYSDAKITNIVIGMYLPVIAAMFLIGFPVGWFIVSYIINYLTANTTWVLPLFFTWWIPVVVGVLALGIYTITFIIEWYSMKRIKPLQILNEVN